MRPRCLASGFESVKEYFESWTGVIAGVSDDVIWSVCNQAEVAGVLLPEEATAAVNFLSHRKSRVQKWLSIGMDVEEESRTEMVG